MIERDVLVLNSPTWSGSGEPVSDGYDEPVYNEGGSPLPELTLNFRQGKEPEIVADSGERVPCRCRQSEPLPELTLNFATAADGGTITRTVADGDFHSYDTTILGGQPTKIGGRHGTDSQYGDGPAIRQAPDERMSDDDMRRIGLLGERPLDSPTLVHRIVAGKTVSTIE